MRAMNQLNGIAGMRERERSREHVFDQQHCSRVRSRSRRGYTLLELLAYIAIFGVVINLAAALFVSATRLRMLGNEALERMQALDEMGTAFSDVVRESVGVAETAGAYRTTSDTLVLTLPGEQRYAVLGRLRADDRLALMRFEAGDGVKPEFLKTFPHPVGALEFAHEHDPGGRARVVMRLDLRDGSRRADVIHTFIASPRSHRGTEP